MKDQTFEVEKKIGKSVDDQKPCFNEEMEDGKGKSKGLKDWNFDDSGGKDKLLKDMKAQESEDPKTTAQYTHMAVPMIRKVFSACLSCHVV